MIKSIAVLLTFILTPLVQEGFINNHQNANNKAKIQVALLLDTSNSMDGLIDQAKSQLWKMVNELATSKKDGQTPDIEIALYEYGNNGLNQERGYIRNITALTTDLDLVSEKLFELKTNGGNEYCGFTIQTANDSLSWSNNNEDLKLIIIAGNEPFNQGPVNFKEACKKAIENGIMINTIYCGEYNDGIKEWWKEGADLTDGKYMNIDTDEKVVHIPTPFDDEIIELNRKLNDTYIRYGMDSEENKARQSVQDANAAAYGKANMRTRASFKAKESYKNTDWDLVDKMEDESEFLEEVEAEQLPEEMQGMSKDEQKKYVEQKKKERVEIQAKIRALDQKAQKYVLEQQKANAATQTLDQVLIQSVKEQAEAKKFKF